MNISRRNVHFLSTDVFGHKLKVQEKGNILYILRRVLFKIEEKFMKKLNGMNMMQKGVSNRPWIMKY
jgi:hypothetical protein